MSAVSPVRGFIRGFVCRKGRPVALLVGALAGAAGQDMSKLPSSRTLSCAGRLPCRTAHARFARGPRAVHLQCDAIHCAGTLCPRRGLLRTHRSRQYRQEPRSCSERGASAQPSQRRCTRNFTQPRHHHSTQNDPRTVSLQDEIAADRSAPGCSGRGWDASK